MRERINMALFFSSRVGDAAISTIGFALNHSEEALVAKHFVESGNTEMALMSNLLVTTILIGCYALTTKTGSRFAFSFDKAIRISNIIGWSVLALNTLRVNYGF